MARGVLLRDPKQHLEIIFMEARNSQLLTEKKLRVVRLKSKLGLQKQFCELKNSGWKNGVRICAPPFQRQPFRVLGKFSEVGRKALF